MTLYLLRHAEAEPHAPSDDERKLTERGRAQAQRVGQFCREHALIPGVVLTSPVLRARETAELFAQETGLDAPIVERFLACGMSPGSALDHLKAFREFERVMIVGHEPDFSLLIAALLGLGDAENLRVRKASLTAVKLRRFASAGAELEFFLPVSLL